MANFRIFQIQLQSESMPLKESKILIWILDKSQKYKYAY